MHKSRSDKKGKTNIIPECSRVYKIQLDKIWICVGLMIQSRWQNFFNIWILGANFVKQELFTHCGSFCWLNLAASCVCLIEFDIEDAIKQFQSDLNAGHLEMNNWKQSLFWLSKRSLSKCSAIEEIAVLWFELGEGEWWDEDGEWLKTVSEIKNSQLQ